MHTRGDIISKLMPILNICSQFVPFRDFMDATGDVVRSQARLAKEVLAEIPDQFLSYMKSRNIKPKPAVQRPMSVPNAPVQ